ncbi:MAG: hypothetical protein NUW37_01115 [Planctomycetes bacterium]|nr:hypothetical protein [Planctomycetota bacterium]
MSKVVVVDRFLKKRYTFTMRKDAEIASAFELAVLEVAMKFAPDDVKVLRPIVAKLVQARRVEEALPIAEKLALMETSDATVCYNLACCYSLLGKVESAFDAIEKAFVLGFRMNLVHEDSDLDNMRLEDKRRFDKLVEKYFERPNPGHGKFGPLPEGEFPDLGEEDFEDFEMFEDDDEDEFDESLLDEIEEEEDEDEDDEGEEF